MKHFFSLMRGCSAALLLLLWLAGPAVRAQAPAWELVVAARLTGTVAPDYSYSYVNATTTDAAGNVYLVGNFFGDVTLGGFALNQAGVQQNGIFVAKWSRSSNSFVWVQSTTGGVQTTGSVADVNLNPVYDVAVQGTSVYITGIFHSPAFTFGSTTLLNTNTNNYGEVYVAKLTDAGNSARFVWALKAGGAGEDIGAALAVSGSNVYLAGAFGSAQATFGSITLANAGAPSPNGFVAKLVDDGSSVRVVWALSLGGAGYEYVNALAVTGSELFMAGIFSSASVAFGPFSLAKAAPANFDESDVFVAKLLDGSPAPSFAWAQRGGGTGSELCSALATSGSNVYLTGEFYSSTTTFGASTLVNANSGSNGLTPDVYVAKLADAGTSGSFVWAVRAGGPGNEYSNAMAVAGSQVLIAGGFGHPTATFGTTVLTNTSLASYNDIFVAKLTDTGPSAAYAWAKQAGGPSGETAKGVAVSGSRVYVAGGVSPMATFGALAPTPPGNTAMAFLAALTDSTFLTTATEGNLTFTLFPNPARTAATVELLAVPDAAIVALTLLDALGRPVRAETLRAAGLYYELDLRGLAPGIYALQVQAGVATATRRLVVE